MSILRRCAVSEAILLLAILLPPNPHWAQSLKTATPEENLEFMLISLDMVTTEGDCEGMLYYADRIIEVDPGNNKANQAAASCLFREVDTHWESGEVSRAIWRLAELQRFASGFPVVRSRAADGLRRAREMADAYEDNGEFADAYEILEALRGVGLAESGQVERQERLLRQIWAGDKKEFVRNVRERSGSSEKFGFAVDCLARSGSSTASGIFGAELANEFSKSDDVLRRFEALIVGEYFIGVVEDKNDKLRNRADMSKAYVRAGLAEIAISNCAKTYENVSPWQQPNLFKWMAVKSALLGMAYAGEWTTAESYLDGLGGNWYPSVSVDLVEVAVREGQESLVDQVARLISSACGQRFVGEDRARCLYYLGEILYLRRDLAGAKDKFDRAFKQLQKQGSSTNSLDILMELAEAYEDVGAEAEAREVRAKAVSILDKARHDPHPGRYFEHLGDESGLKSISYQGNSALSREILNSALETAEFIARRINGKRGLEALTDVASSNMYSGNLKEAEQLLAEVSGKDNSVFIDGDWMSLANQYVKSRDFSEALRVAFKEEDKDRLKGWFVPRFAIALASEVDLPLVDFKKYRHEAEILMK